MVTYMLRSISLNHISSFLEKNAKKAKASNMTARALNQVLHLTQDTYGKVREKSHKKTSHIRKP